MPLYDTGFAGSQHPAPLTAAECRSRRLGHYWATGGTAMTDDQNTDHDRDQGPDSATSTGDVEAEASVRDELAALQDPRCTPT